jgi:hypothetical protein
LYACNYVVALGVVDPLVASAPSHASLAAVYDVNPSAHANDEIPLPLYIFSGRSGNGSFPYETASP